MNKAQWKCISVGRRGFSGNLSPLLGASLRAGPKGTCSDPCKSGFRFTMLSFTEEECLHKLRNLRKLAMMLALKVS
jgi:hypothetical protein